MKNFIIILISSIVIFLSFLFFFAIGDQIRFIYIMNACFATSALMIIHGLFTHINNAGGFDALKYASRSIIRFRINEGYGDYKERMYDKPKKRIYPSLIIGLVFLVISFILNIVIGF